MVTETTCDSHELHRCLKKLAAGNLSAREDILRLCEYRLHAITHRMLQRFPRVRRWNDTHDVFQNAAMRLHRALETVPISSARSLFALAATQIHRELIDLVRHHTGPRSFAANHETHGFQHPSDGAFDVPDRTPSIDLSMERWNRFHDAVTELPHNEQETFRLVWYMGADQKTIAQLMGCSIRTVKTHWRAAKEKIRHALENCSPEDSTF